MKHFLASKTLWVNSVILVGLVLAHALSVPVDLAALDEKALYLLPVVNILLRLITKSALTASK